MATLKRVAIVLLGVGVFVPVSVSRADSYSLGSIQGQNGWSGGTVPIVSTIDQGVTTAAAHTGSQSWLMSNSTADGFPSSSFGIFGGFPFGPGLSVSAGQPSSGAGADTFQSTFWFKTADTTAGDGSYVQFDFGNTSGTDRNTFLGIENKPDDEGGLVFRVAESIDGPSQFLTTQTAASGLSRSTWHEVVLTGHFLDGDGNDYFTISLDGTDLINTDTSDPAIGGAPSPNAGTDKFYTFEGYQNAASLAYATTNRMFFLSQLGGSGFGEGLTDTSPQGFYVDDLSYDDFNSDAPDTILASFDSDSFEAPEPASLVLIAVGGMCMISRRPRKD